MTGYADAGPLTSRMRDVLAGAARGQTAAETARGLHVSERTVRAELSAAYVRLGARNACEAVAIAIERGELRRAA